MRLPVPLDAPCDSVRQNNNLTSRGLFERKRSARHFFERVPQTIVGSDNTGQGAEELGLAVLVLLQQCTKEQESRLWLRSVCAAGLLFLRQVFVSRQMPLPADAASVYSKF
jgi:hypothetical protein